MQILAIDSFNNIVFSYLPNMYISFNFLKSNVLSFVYLNFATATNPNNIYTFFSEGKSINHVDSGKEVWQMTILLH